MILLSHFKPKVLHPLKISIIDICISLFGAWRVFLFQQRQSERRLIKEKYSNINNTLLDNYVIYMSNGYTWHGGLADRLKGIVSVFEWCKENNKNFAIYFIHPFNLYDYLLPNKYDWNSQFHKITYNGSTPKICLMEPRTCHKKEVKENSYNLLNEWMNKNFNLNTQIHVYTNMNRGIKNFSPLFNELFKPSEKLQAEIDKNLESLGNKYISISFRFTTIMGDFTDCAGKEYQEDDKVQLLRNCIQAVKNIKKNAPTHDKILITADSERFLNYAKENLKDIYIIPGKVGHIDYCNSDDVNMKTFLDFMLISKAQKVYLVKNKDMYNSAFAKTAAMVNNKEFEVINI